MSQENNEQISASAPTPAATQPTQQKMEFTFEQLQQLIASAVAVASKTSSEELAKAIRESAPTYKSPAKQQNEDATKKANRELMERIHREIVESQTTCPHKQGCNSLSNFQSSLSSFVLHVLDTGDVIGICTNCQKIIRHSNTADAPFFKDKSANVPSQSGRRYFIDQRVAITRGTLHDLPSAVKPTETAAPVTTTAETVTKPDEQLVQ